MQVRGVSASAVKTGYAVSRLGRGVAGSGTYRRAGEKYERVKLRRRRREKQTSTVKTEFLKFRFENKAGRERRNVSEVDLLIKFGCLGSIVRENRGVVENVVGRIGYGGRTKRRESTVELYDKKIPLV